MSISSRQIATESLIAGGAAAGIAVIAAPANPWLPEAALHPGWLAVVAMAAFYGLRGLMVATPIVWAAIAATALVVGADLGDALTRASSSDASALLTALLVAGAAMVHRRRADELTRALAARERDADDAERRANAMRELAAALQLRQDRIDTSIEYWRDLAARLEGTDRRTAAEAALELLITRTGARGGLVRSTAGGRLQNLAWRGHWSPGAPVPSDIFPDRTIDAAIRAGRVTLADQVADARPEDSDVAAPIVCPSTGELLGVLALRGARRSRLRASEIADLTALTNWLASTMAPGTDSPEAANAPEPAEVADTLETVSSGGAVVLSMPPIARGERTPTWD